LAPLLQMPFSTLAALGFVAAFADASNTPITSTVMDRMHALLAWSVSYFRPYRHRAQRIHHD
jgi:hypothetical protein